MKPLLLGLLTAFAVAAQTTPTFNARADIAAGQGVVVGDFNGDGIQDLVVVYGYVPSQTFFGNGDGTFRPGPIDSLGTISSYANYAIDMNNDGKLDIVAPGVRVCLGNGDGTFQPCITSPTGAQCNSITIGDMNGDGFPDVIAATGAGVEIFLNNGDGSLALPTTILGSLDVYGIGVADLNADGRLDIVAGSVPNQHCPCVTTVALATATGYTTVQTMTVSYSPGQIVFADFNHDGKLDMATSPGPVSGGTTIDVYLGNGAGTFPKPIVLTDGDGVASLAVGDMNGDGIPDLVVGDQNVAVYLGKGNGSFASPVRHSVGSTPQSISLASLHTPGVLDIVTANIYSFSISILLNQGTGIFHEDVHIPIANSTGIPVVADFNGDGLDDFAELTNTGIAVYLNTGILKTPFTLSATLTATARYALAADFNGDGRPDIAVALTDGDVEIFPGLGNGQFGSPVLTHTGIPFLSGEVFQIAAADINGDKKLDLLGTTNFKLIGNGDFTFQAAKPIWGSLGSYTDWVFTITPVDLNRDGKVDVILGVGGDSGGIITMLNTGGGNFALKAGYLNLAADYQVVTRDFNGDGIPDAALVAGIGLYIYLGNGDGTMTQKAGYIVEANYSGGLAVGALGPGSGVDLAFSAGNFSYLQAFTGNGDGTFQVPLHTQPALATGVYQGNGYLALGNFQKPFTQKFPDQIVTTLGGVDILYNTTR